MKSIANLCLLAALFALIGTFWLLALSVPQTVQDAGGLRMILAYQPQTLWNCLAQPFSLTVWRFLYPAGLVAAGVVLGVQRLWRNFAGARKKRRSAKV